MKNPVVLKPAKIRHLYAFGLIVIDHDIQIDSVDDVNINNNNNNNNNNNVNVNNAVDTDINIADNNNINNNNNVNNAVDTNINIAVNIVVNINIFTEAFKLRFNVFCPWNFLAAFSKRLEFLSRRVGHV